MHTSSSFHSGSASVLALPAVAPAVTEGARHSGQSSGGGHCTLGKKGSPLWSLNSSSATRLFTCT